MAKYLSFEGVKELVAQIKTYVDAQVGDIDMSIFRVVSSLPTSDIDENKIYLVPGTNTENENIYTEYVYANEAWEKLGEVHSEVDLSGYVNSASGSGTNCTVTATISGNALSVTVSVPAATTSSLGVVQVTEGNGLAISSGVVSMSEASSTAAGALSASDKAKLDDLEVMEEISDSEIDELFA